MNKRVIFTIIIGFWIIGIVICLIVIISKLNTKQSDQTVIEEDNNSMHVMPIEGERGQQITDSVSQDVLDKIIMEVTTEPDLRTYEEVKSGFDMVAYDIIAEQKLTEAGQHIVWYFENNKLVTWNYNNYIESFVNPRMSISAFADYLTLSNRKGFITIEYFDNVIAPLRDVLEVNEFGGSDTTIYTFYPSEDLDFETYGDVWESYIIKDNDFVMIWNNELEDDYMSQVER